MQPSLRERGVDESGVYLLTLQIQAIEYEANVSYP